MQGKQGISIFSLLSPGLYCLLISFSSTAEVDFARDIQPIFAEHCSNCHGPDKQKGGLNLTDRVSLRAKLKSGKHAVVPGKPDQSELIYRLTTTDADEQMPPPEKGKPLPAKDIAKIRQWIAEGGKWTQHWAYRPLDSKPRAVNGKTPARNQIDWFIYAKLKTAGVPPSTAADRPTLIKRLSYDLLGLPPTPSEVDDFVNDTSANAYGKLVDRLLASPHFGERWGRHWLDKARYADSDGFEKDKPRMNAWRYRDWVIEAINSDLPFDQFTINQLAGVKQYRFAILHFSVHLPNGL